MKANQGATLTRLLTAIVLLPVVLALVWIDALNPVFALFIAALVAVGLYEFFAMARARKIETWPNAAIAFGVLMVLAAYLSPNLLDAALVLGVIVLAGARSSAARWTCRRSR
jgi:CDP-diglyceride synthetase